MCQERLMSIKKDSCFRNTRARHIIRRRVVVVAPSSSDSNSSSNSNSSFSDFSSPPSSPPAIQDAMPNQLTNPQLPVFAISPPTLQQIANSRRRAQQVRRQEIAPTRPNIQQLRSRALLDLAMKIVNLEERSRMIQKQVDDLLRETAEFVRIANQKGKTQAAKPQSAPNFLSK